MTDFLEENKAHFKEVLDVWDYYDIDFDKLSSYFKFDEFFELKPGGNEFEFSDDTSGGLDENVDCLMHHALEKEIDSPRFKSKVDKWHIH